jgi:hypothetical protein
MEGVCEMSEMEARRIRYKIVTLALDIAKADEKYEIAGYNLAVLSVGTGALAQIKFNNTTGEAIELSKVKYIESKFDRFFITSTAQAGLTIVLVVGEENFKLVPA